MDLELWEEASAHRKGPQGFTVTLWLLGLTLVRRRGTVACGAVAVAQQFAAWWLGQPDILATAPHRESVPCAPGSMAASARGTGE